MQDLQKKAMKTRGFACSGGFFLEFLRRAKGMLSWWCGFLTGFCFSKIFRLFRNGGTGHTFSWKCIGGRWDRAEEAGVIFFVPFGCFSYMAYGLPKRTGLSMTLGELPVAVNAKANKNPPARELNRPEERKWGRGMPESFGCFVVSGRTIFSGEEFQ